MPFTKDWVIAMLIRMVRTMAQTALSVIGVSYVLSDVNWGVVLSASMLSGIVCCLMAIGGLPEANNLEGTE